jgi:DNA-binding MarR family transcriptional regulator
MEKAGYVVRGTTPEDGRGIVATMTDKGLELLAEAAPLHVEGVRSYLLDVADKADFDAVGRVMDAVSDQLIAGHPEMEIR